MRRRAVIQMILIGVLAGILMGGVAYFIPWLPDGASKEAGEIDAAFWFVAIICALIFALVAGVAIYAGWKFRAKPDDPDDGSPIHGHTGLEIWWTAIPAALVVAMSVFSAVALAKIQDLPDDHGTINVTSQQFAWSFTYPDADDRKTGELVLLVDEPVMLNLESKDVIHSFWVPEFRMKQDAVPGIETHVALTPTKLGTYDVICTELCGVGHSVMRAVACVLGREDYERWRGGADVDERCKLVEGAPEGGGGGGGGGDGEAVFAEAGCGGCHTFQAAGSTEEVGPNLDTVLADRDEEFVRESIVDPNAEIAEGYQPDVMPGDFGERLSEEDLDALVQFLLGGEGGGR